MGRATGAGRTRATAGGPGRGRGGGRGKKAAETVEEVESSSSDESEAPSSSASSEDEQVAVKGAQRKRPPVRKPTKGASASGSRPRRRQVIPPDTDNDPAQLGKQLLQALQAAADEAALKEAESALPVRHYNEKTALVEYYRRSFGEWRLQLRQGFNLLFYGLGSKLKLLESFAEAALTDGGVLAVNGFNARLTARQVVVAAASTYFGKSCRGVNPTELLAQLSRESGERSLYLVVHNIDGPGLNSAPDQLLLSELARCRCLHLVASVDHVNAPLLWSHALSLTFNWLWIHTPTYLTCATEALDTPSVLAGWGQQSQRRGASSVLHSLVPTARHVFKLLANVLTEDRECEGLAFSHWFRLCRERFLVSTEQALRGHLTEFRDHELVKTRTNSEGLEVLYIPLDADALSTMLKELEGMEKD